MSKEKDNKIRWIMGVTFALIIFSGGVIIGQNYDRERLSTPVTCTSEYSQCEYSNDGLYFKGYCSDVSDMVETEKWRQESMEGIDQRYIDLENDCKEYVGKKIWINMQMMCLDDATWADCDITEEEFKAQEEFQLILNLSCNN